MAEHSGTGPGRTIPARATLGSVAARAGVSKQTVSNVINSPHMVREDTAAKVLAAIDELGYRPHRAAQQLRTRRSRVFALRVQNRFPDAVFDRFLHALTGAAGALDYRIMLYTADDDAGEITAYDELLDRWDIDGFVLTGTHPGDTRTAHLSRVGVPCVTFGRPWDDSGHHPWVDVDGAAGTRAATEHLVRQGHRRIGFLGWPDGSGVGGDRLSGWANAIRDAGLDLLPPSRAVNDAEQGRSAAAELIDRTHPTAIVCASDVLALGAISEITARGMNVGADVAVIGFDDTDISAVAGLSSLAQPLVDVAAHCARLLATLVENPSDSRPEQVLLEPQLVIRSSSAPVRR
ncbi:DNA-binding transcriptional regulator, LacI/PurR family [Nakamurella panacisegetis]|uniref:DNA-binding transcriptional regulator, LacI/PurR family n=1 Tax=Nakamurella panacisegetis TaxID=1090615 RepID=A0A1H0JN34_9ACTN|nr:LacI family DNA-binding transcriptional regulator [Nakamurella panacisegetis]SDO45014.1 DNA-binding transcriptional regulator, LacI/PurR family [Nakamurella panacisegetis]